MIQTQLLRLDPPYQIISAGGLIGIQVATLIVTEEKQDGSGEYTIVTHSHPVVNYGAKQEVAKRLGNDDEMMPDDRHDFYECMQPEGAVWNKVEIKDVWVLGLAGYKNRLIFMEEFITLVPWISDANSHHHIWNELSVTKMYDLLNRFRRVGLDFYRIRWIDFVLDEGEKQMFIELDTNNASTPLVHVVLVQHPSMASIFVNVDYWFYLFERGAISIDSCVANIVNATSLLFKEFIEGPVDKEFTYLGAESSCELNDLMEKLVQRVNISLDLTNGFQSIKN